MRSDHALVSDDLKRFIIERVLVIDGDEEVRGARAVRDRVAALEALDAVNRFVTGAGGELIGCNVDTHGRASAIVRVSEKIYRIFAFQEN